MRDVLADQNACYGLITTAQAFPQSLDIWDDSFLFPRVHRPCPAHTAHDLIQDEECAMLVTDRTHGLEIAWYGWDTSQSLIVSCQRRSLVTF